VDEASLISARDTARLLRRGIRQARVVLVGDTKQLDRSARAAFGQLQAAGMETATLTKSSARPTR